MADLLPVDTTSPAIAELAPLPRRKSTKTAVVEAWNLANPIGTWVVAYPGAPGDRPVITRVRAGAALSRSGRPVVWLEGYYGYLRLQDVTAITQERAGQLLEQDHQFLDLDADSIPFPGAVYGSYLQPGGQS